METKPNGPEIPQANTAWEALILVLKEEFGDMVPMPTPTAHDIIVRLRWRGFEIAEIKTMENKEPNGPLSTCPTCGAPAHITWSGLDLVAESGDETLAERHYEYATSRVQALEEENKRLQDELAAYYLCQNLNLVLKKGLRTPSKNTTL